MLKILFTFLKWAGFALLILLLAHTVEWRGRTVSDHVRVSLAKARTTEQYRELRSWTDRFVEGKPRNGSRKSRSAERTSSEIAPTEREKLRQLLQEIEAE
jgi:hypothetical protein